MKLIKFLIFTIILVLILGGIIVTLIYFYTDTFKPNQEIFYKYISEEQASKLVDTNLVEELIEKIIKEDNEQNIKITIDLKKGNKTVFDSQTIEMENKIDYTNKMLESKMKFSNYINDDILSLTFVRNSEAFDDEEKDVYALSISGITNGYMALENMNLKIFVQNLGLNNSKTKNTFEVNQYISKKVTKELSNKLPNANDALEELYMLLRDNTDKTNYSKLGKTAIKLNDVDTDANGYELSLRSEKFNEILNKAENEIISSLKNRDLNYSQKIFLKNKNLVKTEITIDNPIGTVMIHIAKEEHGLYIKYYDEDNDIDYILNLKKEGDLDSDQIHYTGSLNYNSKKQKINLNMDFDVSFIFSEDIEVEEITGENSTLLNDYDGKDVLKILQIVIKRIRERDDIENSIAENILNDFMDNNIPLKNAIDQAGQEEIQKFNSRFTEYEGEISGINVKSLITIIETSNSTGERQVQLKYNGEEKAGNELMDKIDTTTNYIISLDHDQEGYVNSINIEE